MQQKVTDLLNKMDADLTLLLRELEKYSENKLNEKPTENSWSVFQVMHHLMTAERLSHRYVEKKLSFEPELKNAGILSGFRKAILSTYLSLPFKFKAPAAVNDDSLPERSTFWDVAKTWKNQREALRNYLEELPPEMFKKEIYKHPLAGRMPLKNMLLFFDDHFERHRKQIFKTLKKVDAVKHR